MASTYSCDDCGYLVAGARQSAVEKLVTAHEAEEGHTMTEKQSL